MARICETIVNNFSELVFGGTNSKKNHREKQKDIYTLSSVFPSKKVMRQVKKYL